MNDEESCMDEEPSALSEFVTNIKSPNRQQEEQPRTSEMVSTEYDTTSITIESIVTSRNEDDDDVVEVLEGSHTPEMVLQPNLISPVLELGVVQPNWAVETVVVVNVVEEEDDVEPVVSQVLGNVIEIIEAETETKQQSQDDDNDEVVEIEKAPAAETNVIEPATTTAEVEATVGAETNEIGADVVEIETTPNIETTSTAEATTTDEVEAMVVETNSIEATTVTDTETNVIEPAATTAEVEVNALEIETTSTAEQTEQIEQMSEEEEEPPKSGNPVQQPLVVIVAPVSETTASETTTQNHSTSNKESLGDASSERNIDVLSPPKSAETMMSSGTSSSRAAESSNDQTSIASPLSNAKRPENPEKTKSIKTSEKLMLRYRKIRRVRDIRETEIVLVCDVVSARDGRLIDSKQLADMKFTHELSSTSRCKVVCERRVSQAELDNELKQMKEEFEENEENFTDNDENENNENHSDNRSQRVNEKIMTKSVSTSPQETTNRHEKSKSHRGEKRTSSTNPNAIANPVGRPRTKSHQERSNRRLAHQDMNDTNSNTSTATTPQQQQSARSLRKRKVPFSPSANSSLLGINEDEDDNTTTNNEEKSVKRRTKTTRLASPSRQQPSTPTRTDKTPVKDKEIAATGTTKTPAAQTTTTTSTKKPADPPLFASLCFDLAPKKTAIVESPLIVPSPNLMETNAIEENFDLMPVEESHSEERLTTATTNGTNSSIQIRFGRNSKSLTKKTAVETNKTSLVVNENEKKKVVRENNDDEYICISDSSSENIGPVESPQKSSAITKSPSKSPSKPASKSPSMTNGKENNNNNNNDNNSSVPRITDPKDKRECRIVLKRLSLDEIARLMRTTPTATPTTPSDKKRQQQAIEIDLSTPSPKSSPDGYSVGELVWARGRGGHFYPAKVRQVELTPASRTRLFTVVYLKPSTKRHVQMAEPNDRTLGDYLTAADLVRFDDLKCSQLLLFYRDDDAGSNGDNESDEEVKRRLYPGFLVAYDSAASPRSVSNYLIVDGLLTDRSQREAAYDFDDDPVLTRLRIPLQSIVVPRKDLLKRPLTTDALIDVKLLKNIESIKNLDDKPIVVNASNTKTSSDSQKKSKMSLKAILSATQPTTSAKPTKTARKRTQTRENPKKRHKSTSKTRTASNSRVKDSHQEKVNRIALIDNEDDDDDDEEEDDMPLALLDESIEDYESPDIIPDDIEYDLASNYNSNEMTASSNSMAAGKTSTTTTTMLASTSSRSGFIVCESSISDENAATIVDPNLISSSRFVGNQRKNSKETITRRKEDRSSSTRSRLRGRNGSTG